MFQKVWENFETSDKKKNGTQTKESANLETDYNSRDLLNNMTLGSPLTCGSKNIPLFYPDMNNTSKEKQHILAYSESDRPIYNPALADFTFSQQINVCNSDVLNRIDLRKITPHKTDNVAEIKGWRNKQFYLGIIQGENMNCHNNRNIASANLSSKKTSFLDIKEESIAEDQHIIHKSIEATPKNIREDLSLCTSRNDTYVNISPEYISVLDIVLEESLHEDHQIIKNSLETNLKTVKEDLRLSANRNITSVNNSPENGSFLDVLEEPLAKDHHITEKFLETNLKKIQEDLSLGTNRNDTYVNISPEYISVLDVVLEEPQVKDHHIIYKSMVTCPTDSTDKYDNDDPTNLHSRFLSEGISVNQYLSKKEIIENPYLQVQYEQESKLITFQKRSKKKYSKLKKISKKNFDKIAHLFNNMNTQNPFSLADVFIWCCTHSRFSCNCTGKIVFLKENKLLWKPSARNPYLSIQDMSEISIYENFPHFHTFSPSNNSARTVGSLFNYKLRNSNPIFKYKRFAEINNFVLSSTNSLLKINRRRILYPHELDIKKPKPSCIGKMETINEVIIGDLSISLCKKDIRNEEKQLSFNESSYMTSHIMKEKGRPLKTTDTPVTNKSYGDEVSCIQDVKTISAKPGLEKNDKSTLAKYPACYSSNFSLSEKIKENNKFLFKYGLLCLTEGFGFLLVKECTANKLLIQDPLRRNVFRFFKDLETANEWLNSFLKKNMFFESTDINLKWVIVKTSALKYSHPFDKSLIEQPSKKQKFIIKDGKALWGWVRQPEQVSHSVMECFSLLAIKIYVNKDGVLIDMHSTKFKQEINESISQHHQLLGRNITKRACEGIIEDRSNDELVPFKKVKAFSVQEYPLLNHKIPKLELKHSRPLYDLLMRQS